MADSRAVAKDEKTKDSLIKKVEKILRKDAKGGSQTTDPDALKKIQDRTKDK